MIQTAQRDYTKGGLCEWFLSQKNDLIPFTSNQTCSDKATFFVCNAQCKDNVSGRSFRFKKKKQFHFHPWLQRVPFLFMQILQPAPYQKKKSSPQMLHCRSVQTKFLTYFKRSLFSPSVALSLFILFSQA